MKIQIYRIGALGALLLLLLLTTQASAINSSSFAIDWDVFGGGGGVMTSGSYRVNSTAGQGLIGYQTGTTVELGSGYWYGAPPPDKLVFLPLVVK